MDDASRLDPVVGFLLLAMVSASLAAIRRLDARLEAIESQLAETSVTGAASD
ncbi:MAG TPA: hypothetical protein VMW94_09705 [Actinomycetes bacterium]|nr:hypothetical protein [Actinomycetes bacterium]